MANRNRPFTVTVVTACRNAAGSPDFALTVVRVTPAEFANGVHYDLVEERLAEAGYEKPWVHFDDHEAPRFLIPAVKQYLGLPA
jgi:hypothetical protein